MNSMYLNKLAETFYKLAQERKSSKSSKKQVAQKDSSKKSTTPAKTTQVAKTPAQKIQEYSRNDAFPTPIGELSKAELYKHYEDMAKRIKDYNLIDIFDPDKIVSETQGGDRNSPVHVCMVEGGEGIEAAPGFFGISSFPALLVRFCNVPSNPEIDNMLGYTKYLLDRSNILTSNYIISTTDSAKNKIRNSNYSKYVYVALDMDEDHEADE